METENLAESASAVAPALSPDLSSLTRKYFLSLSSLNSRLLRHSRPAELRRILGAGSETSYTGIIIIASEELPIHGMKSSALVQPCLFPKLWDTEMNLVYEKNMMDPRSALNKPMVLYAPLSSIFNPSPSGLSDELIALVGDKPLRILARGCFGVRPTDILIDKADSLVIISSENNRSLLRDGKVALIVNDEVLKMKFGE
jgi:hypothetical protein